MLKKKDMEDFHDTVYFDDKSGSTTLDDVQSRVEETAREVGIPIAFSRDRVKGGGLFSKTVDDCIVMCHPDHKKDYYNFCIYLSRQGNRVFIHIKVFGHSKQIKKEARSEAAKADRQGKELAYQLGSALGSGLRNIGKSKKKLEEEQEYYATLNDVFDQAF